jgi:hypothetical protein
MTTEQVFEKLWAMGYKLPADQFAYFKNGMAIIADCFPEDEWED